MKKTKHEMAQRRATTSETAVQGECVAHPVRQANLPQPPNQDRPNPIIAATCGR